MKQAPLASWMDQLKSIELPVGDSVTNEPSEVSVSVGGHDGR
jgi:hypothetical protein